jgi:thiamine biosynthesis protein ThiS
MKILLNNRDEDLEGVEMTVSELLRVKNFTFKMLIVKINGELVKKDQYPVATIKAGDDVTVLHLISGG